MRIQHNIAAMNSYRNFTVNNSKLNKNLEKLSSGYRVNRAGDDAAGLAVSEKMRAQLSGLEAAQKNANDGIGLIQTAEGALTEVNDMLVRAVYLAEQAANGTYTSKDRTNLQAELDQLEEEINRIGDTANFNKQKLLDGTTDIKFCIDDDGSQLTIAAWTLKNNVKLNQSITTVTKAVNAITAIKDLVSKVAAQRAVYGANQNRLEHTVKNLGVMRENIQNAESQVRDTDIAEEMTSFTKNSIMSQAAQAMVAQANQVPQGVLQLLQ